MPEAGEDPRRVADGSSPERARRRAQVLGDQQVLGPLGTPGAALRFRVTGPFGWFCARTGWLGQDISVRLTDGERVVVPLAGLTVRADAGHWVRTYDLPPVLPGWLASTFHRGVGMWWELSVTVGMWLELEEDAPPRRQHGYRDHADGVRMAERPVLHIGGR